MNDLLIWIALWFSVWTIWNAYFRWKLEHFKSKKYVPRGLFFLIAFGIIYYYYFQNIFAFSTQLLFALILTNLIGIFLSQNKTYSSHFLKDRFFILFQTFNILFQQTAILVSMILLRNIIESEYKDIYFGLFFIGIHFPLVFLPWAKLKYYILASCFFGGWIFSYLNSNFEYGVLFSFLIHYFLYVWEIFYVKDEEKI